MNKVKSVIAIILMVFSISAMAEDSPLPMLKEASAKLLSSLQSEKATIKNNPQRVYQLVEQVLLPHVDQVGMARSVLGRDAWTNASDSQKKRFTQEFTRLVVRTYSSALASYQNEEIKFLPIRGAIGNRTRVQVNSIVVSRDRPSVPVSYRCIRLASNWKVYDMSVEGVSLLQSFRSQFTQELSRGNLDQLIAHLKQHNTKEL